MRVLASTVAFVAAEGKALPVYNYTFGLN